MRDDGERTSAQWHATQQNRTGRGRTEPSSKQPTGPMPKRLTLTVPHQLGAAEVRRRLDRHTDWALQRLAKEKIVIEADDWFGNRRSFTASGYGQTGSATIQVGDDSLQIEALVPWTIGVFAPAIEAVGRHYADRLLSNEDMP